MLRMSTAIRRDGLLELNALERRARSFSFIKRKVNIQSKMNCNICDNIIIINRNKFYGYITVIKVCSKIQRTIQLAISSILYGVYSAVPLSFLATLQGNFAETSI